MKAVNLLPSDQRGPAKAPAAAKTAVASAGGSFGAWLVIGVLGMAVLATAAYVLATNTIKDRQAELARVQQEAQVMKARAAALQSYADFKSLADQRVATVKGLAASRFDWERTLDDLSRALPGDVHLSSLNGSTNTSSGTSSSGLRSAIQAPAIEMAGCTSSQHSVADLMSRLRNVRGVTRVALAKSDKDGTQMTVNTAPDGSVAAQQCPKGSPPSFDLVVFFERAQLPATAAPNLPGSTGAQAATGATGSSDATSTTTPGGTTQPAPADSGSATQPSTSAQGATQGVSTK